MRILRQAPLPLLLFSSLYATFQASAQSGPFLHQTTLGPVRRVPYTPPEATPDNKSDEATSLRVRPLMVDARQREWTLGELHEVTDRTFVIRRALRINDALPGEPARWTWQPGPWLQVDRMTTHITVLHLPDFDPQISEVVWFRDYAAYCGLIPTLKGGVMAVVAELGRAKAIAAHNIGNWPTTDLPHPICAPVKWQRTPMRATIGITGKEPITIDVVGTSSLLEENEQ